MPVLSKIIVKVGKRSNLKFRSTAAYRAITMDELECLVDKNSDASIVVIENVLQSEDSRVKQFIKQFESRDEHNKVFFYVEDNDSVTCGIADELAYDIYLNMKDLYKAIKINCGLVVDTDISLGTDTINPDDDIFDDSFKDALETIDMNAYDSEIVEDISSKDDIIDFPSADDIISGDTPTVTTGATDTTGAEESITYNISDKSIENKAQSNAQSDAQSDVQSEIENRLLTENSDLRDRVEKSNKEVIQLKKQLHDAFEKTKSAMDLVKAIEIERDTFREKLSLFEESIVIEEPISLSEYKDLKQRIKELEENEIINSDSSKQSNVEIERLKTELEEIGIARAGVEKQLEDYKARLMESGAKLSTANSDIASMKNYIESLESKVKEASNQQSIELQSAVSDLAIKEASIEKLKDTIAELENSLYKLREENRELENKIQAEVKAKKFNREAIGIAVESMQIIEKQLDEAYIKEEKLSSHIEEITHSNEQYKQQVSSLNDELSKLSESQTIILTLESENSNLITDNSYLKSQLAEANDTIEQFKTKTSELEVQVADVDKRVELARNYVQQELDASKRETLEWKTKFDVINSQFISKEAQYNTLIQSIGMNENGVQSLLENNKTMDEINRTLRDQIVMLKNDLDKARKDAAFAKQTAAALEESNKNMRVSMKAMTVGMSGGVNVSSGVAPFSYQGKGMVIPVFGCGSFGITTTAMSIAARLSSQARVLYIDFDLVAPKADGWFRINPMIRNVPDIDTNSAKATGLGLFVDKQIQYFLSNSSSLILKVIQTKNGCIDYIGGFYTKPDAIKLMSADFASFLNFCGNSYTYIVIDFGRLGSSDINDQIIKAFSDIAYRNVVITTSDKFEIRTFRMKLAEAHIEIQNIAWLVNMCERTNLEDTAKKSISPAQYSMMPFSPDIYGKRIDFTKDRLTKDKLTRFMDESLFRK